MSSGEKFVVTILVLFLLIFLGFTMGGIAYENFLKNQIALKMIEAGHDPLAVACVLK